MLNASYTIPTASNNKVVSMTTNCLSVIFIGQHLGVEKKAPTDPMPMGAVHGGTMSESQCSRHGLTSANSMPRKSETSRIKTTW